MSQKTLFIALFTCHLLISGSWGIAAQPNVIIVMSDDQGYGELSYHGNPILSTPHLDRLASQSVRLTDFHVAPMCTPTRGQLLTGLDAFRNGAMNVSSGRSLLRPELTTMADLFEKAGYRTGIFGKWHLGDNYPFRPQDRGFGESIWFPSSHINSVPDYWDNDYFEDTYFHNGQRKKYTGYCTDIFFRETMNWIKADQKTKPFFAFLPLNAAHWPHFVPEEYRHPIRQAMKKNPQVVGHLKPAKREALISYLAMCANIDDNMGKLDQFLHESELFDNTILIFLTDNGSTMGPDYFNAGMRGRKVTLWEGGHRVPCFIRWPEGKLRQPRDLAELSHVQDLLPTLAELTGIANPLKNLDGKSLTPLLRGEKKTLGDRMLVVNYSRMPFQVNSKRALPTREGAAVLWKHWRFLEDKALYDLRNDPHQDRNVAEQHPEVVSKMRAHLNQWWEAVRPIAMEPQRVIIGSDEENPLLLTACEWLDVFVDQQAQIRLGVIKNGAWLLHVAQPGRYEFELRRWPAESHLALAVGTPKKVVTDGIYPPGKALPITHAKVKIGNQEAACTANKNRKSFSTIFQLNPGNTKLKTWMLDANNHEICGAYYVYVRRLED